MTKPAKADRHPEATVQVTYWNIRLENGDWVKQVYPRFHRAQKRENALTFLNAGEADTVAAQLRAKGKTCAVVNVQLHEGPMVGSVSLPKRLEAVLQELHENEALYEKKERDACPDRETEAEYGGMREAYDAALVMLESALEDCGYQVVQDDGRFSVTKLES